MEIHIARVRVRRVRMVSMAARSPGRGLWPRRWWSGWPRLLLVLPALTALPAFAGVTEFQRVMFVTSVTGTGDLGGWPDAGGDTGVTAADAICMARAKAAGLANPNQFTAWISDSSDDAYCRLHGLGGQVASKCGQVALPADAGPWVRTDGLPFAGPIGALLQSVIYHPPRIDELGNTVTGQMHTGTSPFSGAQLGAHCNDWTSSAMSDLGRVGVTNETALGWSSSFDSLCHLPARLLCFERQSGPPLELPPLGERLAFVTSVDGAGNLGGWPAAGSATGLAAGDAICQSRATAAGLKHSTSFKAWLSDVTVDARDRFVHDGPWQRPDGFFVAGSLADLTSGSLRTAVNVNELGQYIVGVVWTGTLSTGLWATTTCNDWTSSSSMISGRWGRASNAAGGWTSSNAATCESNFRLYCLADLPALIFSDGFESGDVSFWSAVVP